MKFSSLLLFVIGCIVGCNADSEFGRGDNAIDLSNDVDEAFRELLVAGYDMSMSMSLSFSYAYDSEDNNGSDGTTNEDDAVDGNSTSNNTDSTSGTTAPDAPNSISNASTPTTSPPTSSPTEPDPSCFGLNRTDVDALVYVQSSKASIAFRVLENALEAAMREVLPFCEDITTRLRRLNTDSGYFVGNVDLDEAGDNATCPQEWTAVDYNCFVASLSLRVFGNVDDDIQGDILETVQGLLNSTDMQAAMSAESGFVTSDRGGSNQNGDSDSSTSSHATGELSAGRKAMIALLSIAVIALVGAIVYRYCVKSKQRQEPDCEDSDEKSIPNTMAVTDNRESMYASP